MTENVEMELGSFRDQAPTLSSAPSAPAPGLPRHNAGSGGQAPPHPNTAYQYTAGQLYQQTGGGIRVRGSPVNDTAAEALAIEQQLADAKAKFDAVRKQKKLADQQLIQ